MNTVFEVYSKTLWRVRFYADDSTNNLIYERIMQGLHSSRNFFPQEVFDYVKVKLKSRWFNRCRGKKVYLNINVFNNGKWEPVFHWPANKFNLENQFVLPNSEIFEIYETMDFNEFVAS